MEEFLRIQYVIHNFQWCCANDKPMCTAKCGSLQVVAFIGAYVLLVRLNDSNIVQLISNIAQTLQQMDPVASGFH